MTLDEAIKHAEEVADTCEYEASKYDMSDSYECHVACQEGKCAEEHRQLAEWLKDYKRLLKQEPCDDIGEVSDGYHTFNQLYHQRAVLFATIVNQNKDKSSDHSKLYRAKENTKATQALKALILNTE